MRIKSVRRDNCCCSARLASETNAPFRCGESANDAVKPCSPPRCLRCSEIPQQVIKAACVGHLLFRQGPQFRHSPEWRIAYPAISPDAEEGPTQISETTGGVDDLLDVRSTLRQPRHIVGSRTLNPIPRILPLDYLRRMRPRSPRRSPPKRFPPRVLPRECVCSRIF